MASGSLLQYLNITYKEKIGAAADDIEKTMFEFIPSSECHPRKVLAKHFPSDHIPTR